METVFITEVCRHGSIYADACQENGVVLLRRSSSTASDPPICTYLHIPQAGSCPAGAFPAGLRQRRVGGYSCPPNASTPVGSECSGTADHQSETPRPHHRRTRQPCLFFYFRNFFLQGGQQCWALWAFLAACPCMSFSDIILYMSLFIGQIKMLACLLGMYENPFRGLYSAVKTFRLTIDLNLHPL